MSDNSELLREARKLAEHLRYGDTIVSTYSAAMTVCALADLVEKYHKSNAQLIIASNIILAGPRWDEDRTLAWAQGVAKAAPDIDVEACGKTTAYLAQIAVENHEKAKRKP